MRTVPFEEHLLDERLMYPGEPGAVLELGFVRTVFRDRHGVEHLRVYSPLRDVLEGSWEVFLPEDEMTPLELLSPEYPEQPYISGLPGHENFD